MPHGKRRNWTSLERMQLLQEQNYRCQHCKAPIEIVQIKSKKYCLMELDHATPLRFGGADVRSNLICLCSNCHRRKTLMETLSEASFNKKAAYKKPKANASLFNYGFTRNEHCNERTY